MTAGDRFGASRPSRAASASWKSPVEMPRRYRTGSSASRLRVRRAHFGRMRRGEPDPVLRPARTAIPDTDPRDRHRADAGLDRPLRPVTVPHQPGPSILQPQVLHRAQERVRLHLDSLGEQVASAATQHLGQGIVEVFGMTKSDDVGRCLHGVSLSLRGSGRLDTRLDTPPSTHRRHPISRIGPTSPRMRTAADDPRDRRCPPELRLSPHHRAGEPGPALARQSERQCQAGAAHPAGERAHPRAAHPSAIPAEPMTASWWRCARTWSG